MRRLLVILTGLLMITIGAGPAFAEHNDVGSQFVVGNPDHQPSETADGDVSDDLRLIYHAGGSLPFPAGAGTFPRVSPADQSGLALGDWIGFIDGVIEHPGPGFNQCILLATCGTPVDPLYRVNPAPTDDNCQDLSDNAEVGDPTDPDDDACSGGDDHLMPVTFWPPVRVQNHALDVFSDPEDDGSGFSYPGAYGYYMYLFGEGSGVAAGEGSFSHLDGLCEAPSGHYAPGSNKPCKLITKQDLEDHKEPGQRAAACMYRPFFSTLSGGSDDQACPNISEFNHETAESDSSLYIANKPGWYMLTISLNTGGGSLSSQNNVPTLGGNQTNIAAGGSYHYYVNPERPPSNLWCMGPPIATMTDDGMDTGLELVKDPETNEWLGWELDEQTFNVAAHDIDVYIANEDVSGAVDAVNDLLDQIPDVPEDVDQLIDDANAILDEVTEIVDDVTDTTDEVTDPVVDAANAAIARASPTVGQGEEPNRPGDNSWSMAVESPPIKCAPGVGLTDGTESNTYYNRNQATISQSFVAVSTSAALHDYTYTDEDGLPAQTGDQGFNPWHPSRYAMAGSLIVVEDLDDDRSFDGCPAGDDPPGSNDDRCAARMPFDVYNDDAIRNEDTGETIGEFSRNQGFADPTGVYAVLKVTGPMIVLPEDAPGLDEVDAFPDEIRVLDSEGQNCVVFTSTGLLDVGDEFGQGERFRTLIGLEDDTADASAVVDELCGDVTGDTLLIDDGFDDAAGAGGYSLDFNWIPLQPTPEALEDDDDGLSVHYLVTVGAGGDDKTRTNIGLGSADHTEDMDTVAKVWDDGSDQITYEWVDVELFDSEPGEPSD